MVMQNAHQVSHFPRDVSSIPLKDRSRSQPIFGPLTRGLRNH
jgi:hypothetical protein